MSEEPLSIAAGNSIQKHQQQIGSNLLRISAKVNQLPGREENQMNDDERTVFISYAWGGESEKIVNQIDSSLLKRGIKIIRDKRDLGYKGSISEFMERIGRGNCVIVIISDKYLHSPNCMFELIEIAEGEQFYDRIFPIVLTDANIYDPVKRIDYVKYWELKRAELANAIKTLDPANLQGIREDMDLYDRIRDKISSLTGILKNMNTLMPDSHRDSDFSDLYNAIEKGMKRSPAQSSPDTEKDAKASKENADSKDNVTATNGGIGIGKIQIGGDASGNIVIGNDNKLNSK